MQEENETVHTNGCRSRRDEQQTEGSLPAAARMTKGRTAATGGEATGGMAATKEET